MASLLVHNFLFDEDISTEYEAFEECENTEWKKDCESSEGTKQFVSDYLIAMPQWRNRQTRGT